MPAPPADPKLRTSTVAGLPAAGSAGRQRALTDGFRGVYRDNGTAWLPENRRVCNPRDFGAFGDGTSHPISAPAAAAIPASEGTYAAGDEWDYVGIQRAIYAAYGAPVTQGGQVVCSHGLANDKLNGSIFIPGGLYLLNQTLTLRNAIGVTFQGQGRFSTTLRNTAVDKPILETTMVYSSISGIYFDCGAAMTAGQQALVEWTWNGSALTTAAGLAQLSVYDCMFHGNQRTNVIGFRAGRDLYQADNLAFFNCFFASCPVAGFATGDGAYNALNLCFYTCDFGICGNHGIYVLGGNVVVIGGSFQSLPFGSQTGFDIYLVSSANTHCHISGCRSESQRFLHADSGNNVDINSCYIDGGPPRWLANHAYALNACVTGILGGGNEDGKVYKAVSAGTSGGTEPVWNGTTGITDGSVVWDVLNYNVLELDAGSVVGGSFPFGQVLLGTQRPIHLQNVIFSRDDWLYKAPASETVLGSPAQFISMMGVRVNHHGGVNGGAFSPWTLPSVGAAHPILRDSLFLLPRKYGLLFAGADPLSSTSASDVGFLPPDGRAPAFPSDGESLNTLGMLGTLGPPHAIGTNQAGTDTLIQGGLPTGTGAGGKVRLRTVVPGGSSGATTRFAADALTIDQTRISQSLRFQPVKLTTTQRDALTGVQEGDTIWNTTTHQLESWTGSAWAH